MEIPDGELIGVRLGVDGAYRDNAEDTAQAPSWLAAWEAGAALSEMGAPVPAAPDPPPNAELTDSPPPAPPVGVDVPAGATAPLALPAKAVPPSPRRHRITADEINAWFAARHDIDWEHALGWIANTLPRHRAAYVPATYTLNEWQFEVNLAIRAHLWPKSLPHPLPTTPPPPPDDTLIFGVYWGSVMFVNSCDELTYGVLGWGWVCEDQTYMPPCVAVPNVEVRS